MTCAFTARVAGWKRTLVNDEVVLPMIAELEHCMDAYDCFVPVYCFMPDHLHVMFSGWTTLADTWLAMTMFKARTGQSLHLQGAGWRWQPKFYDHVVRGREDWRAHARYIANNPVRAGLVQEMSEHRYTGCLGVDWGDVFI